MQTSREIFQVVVFRLEPSLFDNMLNLSRDILSKGLQQIRLRETDLGHLNVVLLAFAYGSESLYGSLRFRNHLNQLSDAFVVKPFGEAFEVCNLGLLGSRSKA